MPTLDKNMYIPIVITSDDAKTVGITLKNITDCIYLMNKIPALFVSDATGLIMGRNANQKILSEYYTDEVIRGFYIDSDIIYGDSAQHLKELVEKYDKEKKNFILPYKSKKGEWNVWDVKGERAEDINKITGKKIKYAGLGFYYGDIFPGYEFIMTKGATKYEVTGEDVNFFGFLGKKKRYVYCEKPTVGHVKEVQIW